MKRDPWLRSAEHGAKRLEAWMSKAGVSQAAVARALSVSAAAVSDWVKQKKIPVGPYRVAIATYTRGSVPADSWADARERALCDRLSAVEPYQSQLEAEP